MCILVLVLTHGKRQRKRKEPKKERKEKLISKMRKSKRVIHVHAYII